MATEVAVNRSGRLEGKVAIVTGGSRGTGEQIVRAFVAEGAKVAILDVRDDQGKVLADGLGEDAVFVRCDVTSPADWQEAVAVLLRRWERIDVLVNNAAVLHIAPIETTTAEDYLRVLKVNELGPFLGIQAVASPLRAAGGGSIINIGSIDGLFVSPYTSAYAASKFHLRGLGKSAAVELGEYGIRVNTICPAVGNPEMSLDAMPPALRAAFEGVDVETYASKYPTPPIGRHGKMADVGKLCVFLASDDSDWITGADLMLDGGFTAGFSTRMLSAMTGQQLPA
jgi:3alpha(or 20beta)-hydroxysteroid dehydrogenase